ncbi:hypothetical protein NX059_003885 [Plenodomus lindquistii]|nr:hypothetical protein NX059_003885 [Plenodomus lindquistii]
MEDRVFDLASANIAPPRFFYHANRCGSTPFAPFMMSEGSTASLPGIAALPPTTARQIGSGQVLVDPSSVVKELIDNALDARAKSIFVDMSSNTIDTIQVKDDGHGIPAEDRPLVCRRYCTSKIRDLQDLKEVGGKWLGFRGEALSSMAEMSSSLSVTTRVEGEVVAVKLNYQRNGELDKIERESHPVGTTVKITGFFEHTPVRKQSAIKQSSKWLTKARRLLQAYAFARPAVRFRLRVLKAKNNKGDFIYAPGSNASIEDAVLKVIGKECALQCDWTVLEADGFNMHAFLPKPTATGSRISSHGAFISIDARPVSSLRGTVKQMVAAFKGRLRKMSLSLAGVKDPFICVNVVCPANSYDPNIEPAKDDLMFENSEVVLNVFNQLLNAYYPETAMIVEGDEPPTSAQQPQSIPAGATPDRTHPTTRRQDDDANQLELAPPADLQEQAHWRPSMYGIDEDDLQFIQDEQNPIIEEEEEEEGRRDVQVSNPWTIARMNAAVKPRKSSVVNQLPSPAKSQHDETPRGLSSVVITPRRGLPNNPLTPQSSSKVNTSVQLDDELQGTVVHVIPQSPGRKSHGDEIVKESSTQRYETSRANPSDNDESTRSSGLNVVTLNQPRLGDANITNTARAIQFPTSSAPHQNQRRHHVSYVNKPFTSPIPAPEINETWFGQPMRGARSQSISRQKKRSKVQEFPLFPKETHLGPRQPVLNAADRIMDSRLYPEGNTDIRDFFGRGGGPRRGNVPSESFTPVNFTSHGNTWEADEGPHDIGEQLRAYAERASPTRASSAGATSMLLDARDHQVNQQSLPAMRPSSMGSEWQPRPLPMPAHPPIAPGRRPNEKQSKISQEMENHFKAIEAREGPQPDRQPLSTRRTLSRVPPPHEKPKKPTRLRRRTTDCLQRTKSSRLPLERVPHGFHIQNLVLPLQTSVTAIVQSSRKLDMRLNSLEWGYPTEDAFDVFAEPVSASRSTDWTVTLEGVLHALFGRVRDVDTVCLLHQGVQRGFDALRDVHRDEVPSVTYNRLLGPAMGRGVEKGGLNIDDDGETDGRVKDGRNEMETFDMSQYVDLDAESPMQAVERAMSEGRNKSEDEFTDEIDDDMLLDL